jgi:hypothetical protein
MWHPTFELSGRTRYPGGCPLERRVGRHRPKREAFGDQRANRPLRRDLDVFDLARTIGNWHSVFAQAFDVEDDSFADLGFDFSDSRARGYAARKIGDIRRVVTFGLFNDDGVAHMTSRLQTSLLLKLFSVPGARSWLGLPGTVTRPGLLACLNWR